MAIFYNNQIFSLHTKHSTYQMKVDRDFLNSSFLWPLCGRYGYVLPDKGD